MESNLGENIQIQAAIQPTPDSSLPGAPQSASLSGFPHQDIKGSKRCSVLRCRNRSRSRDQIVFLENGSKIRNMIGLVTLDSSY